MGKKHITVKMSEKEYARYRGRRKVNKRLSLVIILMLLAVVGVLAATILSNVLTQNVAVVESIPSTDVITLTIESPLPSVIQIGASATTNISLTRNNKDYFDSGGQYVFKILAERADGTGFQADSLRIFITVYTDEHSPPQVRNRTEITDKGPVVGSTSVEFRFRNGLESTYSIFYTYSIILYKIEILVNYSAQLGDYTFTFWCEEYN
jgi:hypothetical protein